MPSLDTGLDQPCLKIDCRSSRFAVRSTLAELITRLSEWGMSPDKLSEVELVAAEALNNVVEHACEEKDGVPFSLSASRADTSLILQIIDRGKAMPGLQLPSNAMPDATLPTLEVDATELPEGGWGWLLIRDLSERLSYEHDGKSNRLTIEILWD